MGNDPDPDPNSIASLREERDTLRLMLAAAEDLLRMRDLQLTALRQALHDATSLRDATDPEPQLVAETRAALDRYMDPVQGLHPIGGIGVPHRGCQCKNCRDVAETRAAFPANALRGGDGRPTW